MDEQSTTLTDDEILPSTGESTMPDDGDADGADADTDADDSDSDADDSDSDGTDAA